MLDGVIQAIASIPGLIVDGIKGLIDLLISAVAAVAGAVWDFFCDPIGSIVDGITGVLSFLGGLVSSLISALGALLKALFIPSDSYFEHKLDSLNKVLQSRIKVQDYQDLLDSLQMASRARAGLPNLTATIWGHRVTIVDFSFYAKYQGTIYGWVRGVIFVLLIFYNINNVYKMIRADTLSYASGSKSGGGG